MPYGTNIGGAVHVQFAAGSSFSSGTLGRGLNITSLTSGDLWVAYLYQFDTAGSTIASDEAMEIRPGAGDFRTGIEENASQAELRYGSDYTQSATDSAIKGGSTLLYVAKFPDLGQATGDDAQAWVLNAVEYSAMLNHGGVTESNLNVYAGVQVTNSFSPNATLSGNVTLQLSLIGRNNSTPSFFVDELRMGTELADVVAVDSAGSTGVLLVEESWDYGVGSAATTWNGGLGFATSAWSAGTTGTEIVPGLTFGNMDVSGAAAHIQFTAGSGFSAGTLGRSLNTTSVELGDLWMAYLVGFDTDRSTIPDDEFLEVRPGAGDFRSKIDEATSAVGLRYGSDYSISAADPLVKGGDTFLYVMKWADLGSATGDDAQGWVLDAPGYVNMMENGGLTEANLTAYATLMVTNSFSADEALAGNVSLQMVPLGRNNSTPSFFIDELRMGTSLDVVVAGVDSNITVAVDSSILGLSYLPGGLVEMVVNSSFPARSYPKSTTNLVEGSWGSVAHSDDGVNEFVVTNLSYSTTSGANQVIYLQADTAQKFFGIGE